MDIDFYLNIIQQAAHQLDKKLLDKKEIKYAVGIYGESVFLKLYKISWTNKTADPLLSESRIFFSVWINDEAIKRPQLFYNIHALKLRKLNGYKITSRDFANAFRTKFKAFEPNWPNVSTQFGPLTLMEGFVNSDLNLFQNEIIGLANKFLQMEYLIDELLKDRQTSNDKNIIRQ